MNKIESYVYKKVKNNYLLKNSLRNIYQGFFDLLPNYDSKFSSSLLVREGYYFGFHDLYLYRLQSGLQQPPERNHV